MVVVNSNRSLFDVIDEIMVEANAEIRDTVRRIRKNTEETIKKVEANRQALALLSGAGFEVCIPSWAKGSYYELSLGYFPNTKAGNAALADQVRRARLAIGCRLEGHGKSIADCKKKRIEHTLKASDYPGLYVKFTRRLPRNAKCRIVTQRNSYKSLVCKA